MKDLEDVVKKVLETNIESRKDDFILYFRVCEVLGIDTKSRFDTTLYYHSTFKLPAFESVSRARRKLQQDNPGLADKLTQEIRYQTEIEYIKKYGKRG